jgi:hypothetical protein
MCFLKEIKKKKPQQIQKNKEEPSTKYTVYIFEIFTQNPFVLLSLK